MSRPRQNTGSHPDPMGPLLELMRLRDRLAEATGPDLDLNVDIMVLACGWDRGNARQLCPHVTGSLDAAVMLVPDGYWWFGGEGKCADNEPLYAVTFSLARLGNVIPAVEAEHNASVALAFCLARIEYEIAKGAKP